MSDYLKLFSTVAEQTAFRNGSGYIEPHVSCLEDGTSVKYNKRIEFVDLGLPSGTLWAKCNIGANSPEEYGTYLGWGELDHDFDTFDTVNYLFWDVDDQGYTKYNSYDGKTELDAEDDVAIQTIGKGWHIPSIAQVMELTQNCTASYTEINGAINITFTSNINGNSVSFPLPGYYGPSGHQNSWDNKPCAHYWTSDARESSGEGTDPNAAYTLYLQQTTGDPLYNNSYLDRYCGAVIRPVKGQITNS